MTDRKVKTWAEVKARRLLAAEAQAANATWIEQQIVETNFQAQLSSTQADLAESAGKGSGETSEPREPGRLKGRIRVGSDFDAPLPDEILAPFRGEGE